MSNSKLHTRSPSPAPAPPATPEPGARPAAGSPEDALALAWIAALSRRGPDAGGEPRPAYADDDPAEDWIVESLLKLGFAAPDRAYDVGVRIVALSEDPWIIQTVGVTVFADLLRRHGPRFAHRLAHDVGAVPRLGKALVHASPVARL